MRLLVVRHAIAADLADGPFKTDAERTLTGKGRKRMRQAAKGLARLVPKLDAILTSPLVRAMQTAEILSAARGGAPVPSALEELAPGHGPDQVIRRLADLDAKAVVALVGHEPGCSHLVAALLGDPELAIEFRKGGAALLDVALDSPVARATLRFHATPRLLRGAA